MASRDLPADWESMDEMSSICLMVWMAASQMAFDWQPSEEMSKVIRGIDFQGIKMQW